MFGLIPTSEKAIRKEQEQLRKDFQQLHDLYKEMNEEFEIWKERVLAFEYSQLSSDDHPGDDDRVCDGECIRTGEDESDLQRSAEQADGESSDGSSVGEERGQSDE